MIICVCRAARREVPRASSARHCAIRAQKAGITHGPRAARPTPGNGLERDVVPEGLDARNSRLIVGKPMNIEIFSDVACPWCFIGKRRLDRALAAAGVNARLRFRAFQLQPGLPADGVPAESFFERKFGGSERVHTLFDRITALGRAEGIAFAFGKLARRIRSSHIASSPSRARLSKGKPRSKRCSAVTSSKA
jgi:hypothetical protein